MGAVPFPERATVDKKHPLPPGPRSRLLSTYRQGSDPSSALSEWGAQYGATFTVRDITGTTLVTAEPELIKEIFSAPPETFVNAPASLDVLFGPRSLIFRHGEAHVQGRKLLSPMMGRKPGEGWRKMIAELSAAHFGGLAAGARVSMYASLAELTMGVLCRVLFGAEDEDEIAQLTLASLRVIEAAHPSFIISRHGQHELGGLSPYAKFRTALDAWTELVEAQIAKARADPRERSDLLALLTRCRYSDGTVMSDDEVHDNLQMLTISSHETIAAAAAWMLYFIHRHHEVRSRVYVELDEHEAHESTPYLDAVFDEALRLRPPGPQFFRILRTPWTLGKWKLEPGMIVSPAVILVHSNPTLWDQPEQFRPERFLGRRPGPYKYMPFGGGHFRCLGSSLAKISVTTIIASLLRQHSLARVGDKAIPPVRRGFSMVLGEELDMKVLGPSRLAIDQSRVDLKKHELDEHSPFPRRRPDDSLIDMELFSSAMSQTAMKVVRVLPSNSPPAGIPSSIDIGETGPLKFDLEAGIPRPLFFDDSKVRNIEDGPDE